MCVCVYICICVYIYTYILMLSKVSASWREAEGFFCSAWPLQPFSLLFLLFACAFLICVIIHPFWPRVPESAGFLPKVMSQEREELV